MQTIRSRGRRTGRPMTLAALLVLAAGLTACGDDVGVADDEGALDDDSEDVVTEDVDDETAALEGLEVTATGNVTEVADEYAFVIDKDGLGEEGVEVDDATIDDVADIDEEFYDDDYYYDYDAYTEYDEDLGVSEDDVLVIDATGTEVQPGDAVQVTGTVREYSETSLESLYEVDLDDELYDGYEQQLVLVADAVTTGPAVDSTESPSATDSPAATDSPSATESPSAADDPSESATDEGTEG